MAEFSQRLHDRSRRAPGARGSVPPALAGTYALVLRACRPRSIAIGRLGRMKIGPGYYVYVGSAFGPGGLQARLAHHERRAPRPHWHIDYLRAELVLEEIWFAAGRIRREALWAEVMASQPGAGIPVPGFGASDHRGATHLIAFGSRPKLHRFVAALLRAERAHECVSRRNVWLEQGG